MTFTSFKPLLSFGYIFAVILYVGVHATATNSVESARWSKPLHDILVNLRKIITTASQFKANKNNENFERFFDATKEFAVVSRQIQKTSLCEKEVRNPSLETFAQGLMHKRLVAPITRGLQGLFEPAITANIPFSNILGLLHSIRDKIFIYLSTTNNGEADGGYVLEFDRICAATRVTESTDDQLSIKDVCRDVNTCAQNSQRISDPNLRTWLPSLTGTCTTDQKCDRTKALPFMVAIFWNNVNNWISRRICVQRCGLWNDTVHEEHLTLLQESKLLTAFATIVPELWNPTWGTFFTQAVSHNAYSNLVNALQMLETKEIHLNSTLIACNTLLFTEACPFADIFAQYRFVRKSQAARFKPGPIKDLRLYSDLNHAKMLEIHRDTSNHIDLLRRIEILDANLQASVNGISSYFQGVALYDEGIADKDVQFINGEIEKFTNALTTVIADVKDNIGQLMRLVLVQKSLALATEIATLALVATENCNPLKQIFSGPDLDELADAMNAVANAAVDVAYAVSLRDATLEVAKDTQLIMLNLYNNQDQIRGLEVLVEAITKNNMMSVRENADKFIEEYGAYTPQTNRSALEKNNALWSAFKDAACAFAEDDVGIAGAIPKGIITANLLCEKLDGSLAQFFTLREDMYDFQFQLVDAVAQVVRGSISQRLAEDIKGKDDTLHASELMIGFFMLQNKLQYVASAYCDIIEYERLGDSITACQVTDGLFTYENVDNLLGYEYKSSYAILEREVYIPTRASFQGDTGYISLSALQSGDVVHFKLPANETWLRQYRWTLAGEKNVPFLENFRIYLPRKEYLTGENRKHQTMQITVTTNGGSEVKFSDKEERTVYVLPEGHNSYLTVYEEGYSSCPNEINNPYSLCNNLPNLCDTATRETGESIIPTVLSTFKIQLTVAQGARITEWEAPASFTDLTLRATVKLRIPLSLRNIESRPKNATQEESENEGTSVDGPTVSNLRHKIYTPINFGRFARGKPHLYKSHSHKWNSHRPSFDASRDGCCQNNKYRISLENNHCADCPGSSASKHGGLYCEVPAESQAN